MTKDGRRLVAALVVLILFFSAHDAFGMGPRPAREMSAYSRVVSDNMSFIEVVDYNVGNVGVDLRLPGFKCPSFKLCWSWTAKALREWLQVLRPDAVLLQETMGYQQVFGEEWNGPLLSTKEYEGECLRHVCVAWRKDVGTKSPETCSSYLGPYGELLNCVVHFYGRKVQLVSVYYPAVNIVFADVEKRKEDRSVMAQILFEGAQGIVDPQLDMVAGGDFNTNQFTYKEGRPYPENFYTLFGRHVADYGLSGPQGGPLEPPAHDFFGVYESLFPRVLSTHFAFGHYSKFDQVFANFGFPLERPDSPTCTGYACLEGHGGLPPLEEVRPGKDGTDHEGLFVRVGWDNTSHQAQK